MVEMFVCKILILPEQKVKFPKPELSCRLAKFYSIGSLKDVF
jgi:hypothetical protein